MKKKLFGAIFALAITVAAGYGVNKSVQHDADLSDMALSNVEALAWGESGGGNCHTNSDYTHYCNYYDNGPISPCGF